MMFLGSIYIMGSISPYISSYFNVTTSQTQLLLPSLIIIQTLVMAFGAQLTQRLPSKVLMSIAGSIAIASSLSASFVPSNCFPLFAMLFAGGLGICCGLSYTLPIRLGWKAYPERSGLVSGIIIGGFGFGSLLFTYMGTKIVNPNNLGLTSSINDAGEEVMAFPESVAN